MSGWGYSKKKGQAYRKRPKRRVISSSDASPDPKIPSRRTYFSPDDFKRRKDTPKKIPTKEERKKSRFKRVASLNLGNARQFLILTTPVLVQMDPYLTTIYTTWKFGKYGYGIYQKVKREYDINGDYPQALQNVVEQEIEEKVISKIKSPTIKGISQFAAKSIWDYHKERNPKTSIPPEWDNFAVSAMTKTFEEIGAMA